MSHWAEFHNGVAAGLRIAPGISKVMRNHTSVLHPLTYTHLTIHTPHHTHTSPYTHLTLHTLQLDSTWIIFNHPPEEKFSNGYAGFLMALGLHGHLASLSEFHLYNYLQEKHELTVVGLLLGISATRLSIPPSLLLFPSLSPLSFPPSPLLPSLISLDPLWNYRTVIFLSFSSSVYLCG